MDLTVYKFGGWWRGFLGGEYVSMWQCLLDFACGMVRLGVRWAMRSEATKASERSERRIIIWPKLLLSRNFRE